MKSFAAAVLLGLVAATPVSDVEYRFIEFIAKYGKTYATTEEYYMRFELFVERDNDIQEFNRTETTSRHGHNHLSDWTKEERAKLLGARDNSDHGVVADNYHQPRGVVPDWTTGVDWTASCDVSPVKDQGQCGSCWAFSSTGALESAYHMSLNKGCSAPVTQFSEQQLVDCVKSCFGCGGGWPGHSFYYYESHGAYYEQNYPYTATDGTCTYVASAASNVRVSTYTKVAVNDYVALQTAIAQQPISILIDAESSYFQSYTSGVLTNAFLCGTVMDHAVLATGYGVQNGVNYFLVKNSWSTSWGDQGYVKIAADASNNGQGVCLTNYGPIYPTV